MKHIYSKVARLREWLSWFAVRYPQCCYVCGKQIDPRNFLVGNAGDGILLHHIEHDRTKNEATDVTFAHRGCHKSFHRNLKEHQRDIRTPQTIESWVRTNES